MSYILPSIESFMKAVEDFVQEHENINVKGQLCETCSKLYAQVQDICFDVQARGDWVQRIYDSIIMDAGEAVVKGEIQFRDAARYTAHSAFMRGLDLGLRAMQQEMSEKVTKAIEVMEENYKEESKEE